MPEKKWKKTFLITATCLMAIPSAKALAFTNINHSATAGKIRPGTILIVEDTLQQEQAAQAQSFIQSMGDEVIRYISDPHMIQNQQRQHLELILGKNFDMDTISRFTMGRYWRTLNTAQKREYRSLYEDMIVAIYAEKFSNYQGEKFAVSSVVPNDTTNFIVKSHIIPPAGKNISVNWHVRLKNGSYKIVDVAIEDVSMILTQKADFASVIQREGGDASVILDYIRNRIDDKS